MSHAPKTPDDDRDAWADPDLRRAEFRRRLAQKGIFVRLPKSDGEWEPPTPFPVSADEASATVIRMRRGEDGFADTANMSETMSTPRLIDDEGPWSDPDAFRAEFQRRLAERGIFVRLPRRNKEWEPPMPFPVSADEASGMVIRMRRGED